MSQFSFGPGDVLSAWNWLSRSVGSPLATDIALVIVAVLGTLTTARLFQRRRTVLQAQQIAIKDATIQNLEAEIQRFERELKTQDKFIDELNRRPPTQSSDLNERLESLNRQLEIVRANYWQPLSESQRMELQERFRKIGSPTVRIAHGVNTDCAQLAEELAAAFRAAGWNNDGLPRSNTYESLGVAGILVRGKTTGTDNRNLAIRTGDILAATLKSSVYHVTDLEESDSADIALVIGPKTLFDLPRTKES